MYEEEVMQLTEALTSRTVRRNIEESGEIYDREYSIRTPEARTFSTSIRPEDAIPPIDDWFQTSEEDFPNTLLLIIRNNRVRFMRQEVFEYMTGGVC